MYIGPTGYSRISRSADGCIGVCIEVKKITYKYKHTYNTHIYIGRKKRWRDKQYFYRKNLYIHAPHTIIIYNNIITTTTTAAATTTTIRAVYFPYFFPRGIYIYMYDPYYPPVHTATPPVELSGVLRQRQTHREKERCGLYTICAFEYTYINTKIRVRGCSGGASFLPIHFIPFLRRSRSR